MSHSLSLQGAKTQLVNQLVYFDEEKVNFLDEYFPNPGKERNRINQFITSYISALENLLADISDLTLQSIVLIGSQVTLHYLEDRSTESYTIVFPHQAELADGKISFLSPIGVQLLLAKMNDKIALEVPSGEMEVTVAGIQYMNCGEPV